MSKKTKLLLFIIANLALTILFNSCSSIKTVFSGEKITRDMVSGTWKATKGSGAGIYLELYDDGHYLYEEFGTKGQTLFTYSERYFLQGNNIKFRGLSDEAPDRPDEFDVSFYEKSDGTRVMRMVATLAKSWDFVRQGETKAKEGAISQNSTKESLNQGPLNSTILKNLEGLYIFDEGTVIINSNDLTLINNDGTMKNGKINSINGNTMNIELEELNWFPFSGDVAFMTLGGNLTLVKGQNKIRLSKDN